MTENDLNDLAEIGLEHFLNEAEPQRRPDCVDCLSCAVCGRELPPQHRHHHVWADLNTPRGVCERCAD